MLDLGIETPGATISFIDEPDGKVRLFVAGSCPNVAGIDWTPDRSTDEVVILGDTWASGGAGRCHTWREHVIPDADGHLACNT